MEIIFCARFICSACRDFHATFSDPFSRPFSSPPASIMYECEPLHMGVYLITMPIREYESNKRVWEPFYSLFLYLETGRKPP